MQILTSVRNERSLHRAKRVNPTTRSWIPPRTFFTQVRFSQSGNFGPRPGPPATPSRPENAGQKGQKSRPPGLLSRRRGGGPHRPAAARTETPRRRGRPDPRAGRKAGPESRTRDHLKPPAPAAPRCRKHRGIPPPQPASPRFADQLRGEESNSQQPAPPEGRSSDSSDQ